VELDADPCVAAEISVMINIHASQQTKDNGMLLTKGSIEPIFATHQFIKLGQIIIHVHHFLLM
jgi:hypothetical protein